MSENVFFDFQIRFNSISNPEDPWTISWSSGLRGGPGAFKKKPVPCGPSWRHVRVYLIIMKILGFYVPWSTSQYGNMGE